MAASISHELNQPLTGIRNYARNAYYMLEQKPGAEADVKNNLRLISEQVDRAAKIINQMRELTKRSDSAVQPAGPEQRDPRERGVHPAADEALRGRREPPALADGLPPVWGDRIRLEQVFLNLLSNARQAMADVPVRRLVIESRRESPAAAARGRGGDRHRQGLLRRAGRPALPALLHHAQGRSRPGAVHLPGDRPGPQGVHRGHAALPGPGPPSPCGCPRPQRDTAAGTERARDGRRRAGKRRAHRGHRRRRGGPAFHRPDAEPPRAGRWRSSPPRRRPSPGRACAMRCASSPT